MYIYPKKSPRVIGVYGSFAVEKSYRFIGICGNPLFTTRKLANSVASVRKVTESSAERLQIHRLLRLREKHFHDHAFDSLDALETELVDGLRALENDPPRMKSICNWDWIINNVSNAN